MSEIKGNLKTKDIRKLSDCRVEIDYRRKVDLATIQNPTLNPSTKSDDKNDGLWKYERGVTNIEDDGSFKLELVEKHQGPYLLKVLAPDGQVLVCKISDKSDLFTDVEVTPKQFFSIQPHPDRADFPPDSGVRMSFGQRVKLTGRVFDSAGKSMAANLQVVIWASPVKEKGKEQEPQMVLVARTDVQGYFSGNYPRGRYENAFANVGSEETTRAEIHLDSDGRFPQRVILVARLPEETTKTVEDCKVSIEPPRVPDQVDLINALDTYTKDLGGGRCADVTTPNRSIEEFSFYQIVRTSDPVIRGLTLIEPRRLPPIIISLINRWLRTPQGITDGSGTNGSDPPTTTHASGNITTNSPPQPNNHADSQPSTRLTVSPEMSALSDLTIRSDLLKSLISDPDSVTSYALEIAERRSVLDYIWTLLDSQNKPTAGRGEVSIDNPLDWDNMPTFCQATTIAHGHLLHIKQVWRANGYSLGDLLYSLPLAPCQKKQIAVIDWERREMASRREDLTEEERLSAMLSRDRDISEIINSSLTERSRGGSQSDITSFGVGIGAAGPGIILGVAGGASIANSNAWQESGRQLAASAAQSLRDRTQQAASAVRNQRATVIQTVSQGETMRVQTEVVANHNHCHAITIQYFEVLRHFLIEQNLVDVQECLFVPLLMSRFDEAKALRWRGSLQQTLREPSLHAGFKALERRQLNYVGSDLPTGNYAQEALEYLDGELNLTLTIARPRDPAEKEDLLDYFQNNWRFWGDLIGGNPRDIYNAYLKGQDAMDRIFQEQLAPRIAEAFVKQLRVFLIDEQGRENPVDLDPTLVSQYRLGAPLYIRLHGQGQMPSLRREQVVGIRLHSQQELPPDSKVIVQSVYVRYRTRHFQHSICRNMRVMDDLQVGNDVYLPTPLDQSELRNPRQEDLDQSRRLLAHLNENIEYYHKSIWGLMDEDRRYMLLDGFQIQLPNKNWRSVASVVENRLIGIVGNCMVLPVARGIHLDPSYKDGEKENLSLLDHYAPTTPIPPVSVSVPTKGVFAEAAMGACNSCETKDDMRFWRWEESPCGDQPTEITPIGTETRRTDVPNLLPTPLPAPIINLQNAPTAPDPTGLTAALQVLGNPNVFRDVTGLTENQRNALLGLQAAFGAAQHFGDEASKLAKQQVLARDIDKMLLKIKDAKQDGLISDQQAQELTLSALKGMVAEDRQPAPRLTEQPEVKDLVRSASERGNSEVTLARIDERVEVRTDEMTEGHGRNFDYSVPGLVPIIAQPYALACWATAATMLVSWKDQSSLTIEEVMDRAGSVYQTKFKKKHGLPLSEKTDFLSRLELVGEPPVNYSVNAIKALLMIHGPLWVTTDENPSDKFSIHGRIITGLYGDGTIDGTFLRINDPAGGKRYVESFGIFVSKFEELAKPDDKKLGIQVVHYF